MITFVGTGGYMQYRFPIFKTALIASILLLLAMIMGNALTATLFVASLFVMILSAIFEQDNKVKRPFTYTTRDGAVVTEREMPNLSRRSALDVLRNPPKFPNLE